ncbi:MAG: hydroxyacid dehydrogenase [Oscillospiraceae bacterium]|nr:hydroxyacid dehydrogenase [Oscillospiraceae bacterium]
MKTIFLNGDPALIRRVFDDSARGALGHPEIVAPKELERRDLRDVEAVFSTWGMPALGEGEIRARLPALREVYYAAGSVQAFARPFLGLGARVFSAWGANAVPVAEFTVAQIVLANKGFFQSARVTRPREWDRAYAAGFPGNFGARAGLVGCGMIGGLVARMLRAYRLEVLAYDPYLGDARAQELGVTQCSLEELFSRCQTVSNHLPDNERTKGMLGYSLFRRMKPNATFINTGRGAQVAEPDLVRALQEEPGRTALLDVTDPEPPARGSALYALPNVILTPHIAGSMGGEVARMGEAMCSEYLALREGRAPQYEITMEMLETMA